MITEHIYLFLLRSSFTICTYILIFISSDHHNAVFFNIINYPEIRSINKNYQTF